MIGVKRVLDDKAGSVGLNLYDPPHSEGLPNRLHWILFLPVWVWWVREYDISIGDFRTGWHYYWVMMAGAPRLLQFRRGWAFWKEMLWGR